ncbi:NACHT domain- and WD repeat-containing protein 1-like [Patiria miniata]|uniref:NACHT and WD repeat domain-containing protein 1 n=1 Tax=Patiria miniata TaxID=46514 RepID=A0A914AT39_PATMI|nr:NACHT domain- and WD repeat-containing protein 1-like [Patiria miniata]XP_038066824.1 NACHT domain- and WD repeat-containing protein 1-like [Patiria miniata]
MAMSPEAIKKAVLSGDLDIIPPIPSKVVRIFVSSTFGDTIAERNSLLDRAYPTLHDWCVLHDLEFQVVDMRWGVRDEASAYHMTTALCIREIKNCMRLSLGPNFMFILGQRYGWRPSPASIDAKNYQTLLKYTKEQESTLLGEWYLLDENSHPPMYALQPITKEKTDQWKAAGKELPNVLRRAATLAAQAGEIEDEVRHTFFMSVTEQELRAALDVPVPDNHCVGFMRNLNNLYGSTSDANASRYCDVTADGKLDDEARELLEHLKTTDIPAKLSPSNIHHYSIQWTEEGVTTTNSDHKNYVKQFTRTFVEDVKRLVVKAKEQESAKGNLSEDWLFKEVSHHAEFCRSKCKNFCGCEDTLEKIFGAIGEGSQSSIHHVVALHGPSGSGKTSIMAVVANKARQHLGSSAVVILRFLGTSSHSSSILQVLRSICLQICSVYGLPPPSHSILGNFQETSAFFTATLKSVSAGSGKQRPLLIILDSLDQLEGLHGAHKCKWLPKTKMSNVHIVLSTLPGMHRILENLKLLFPADACFLAVNPLPESTGVEIFGTWMKEIHRRITKGQAEIVRQAFRHCRQPLFLKLAFEEARRWRSYTAVTEEALATTIRAAIWKLFARLEVEFGTKVVSHALGYITAARNGLSHSELEDILSIDDEVLDEIYQYWSPPSEEFVRIPPLMWTRLKYELEEYLVERQTDGKTVMVLYHRQFTEAARDRYLCDPDEKQKRHQVMAEFFAGTWSAGQKKTLNLTQREEVYKADRLVAPQPLKRHKAYNYRKLSELPYHLLHAHNTDDLVSLTFGNFSFLEAITLALSAQHLIEELSWVLEKETILGRKLHTELKLLQDTIRLAKSTLDFQDNRQSLAVEILGRLSHLAKDYPQCIGRIVEGAGDRCNEMRETLLVPLRSCFYMPGGPLRTTLIGHSGIILSVAVNLSCSMLATASADGSVRLWELEHDEDIYVLKGQKGGTMSCVAISADDQWLVAGSDENYLQVWSVLSGDPVLLITENHSGYARHANVAVTHDSTRIISPSENDLMVYNINTGDKLHTFRGHTKLISCICISEDDRYAVTGSDDATVKVWSLVGHYMICDITNHKKYITYVGLTSDVLVVSASIDGTLVITKLHPPDDKLPPKTVHVLESCNEKPIYSACLSRDETRVIAGTVSIIYVWDVASGKLLHSLGGHDGAIDCVAVTHDNTHLVSGARDDIMAVWKLTSGRKVQTLEGQQAIVSHLALAKQLVVSASLHSPYIKLWDISPKYLEQRRMMFGDRSGLVAVTTDQSFVIFKGIDPFAKTSVHNIHVWDATTGMDKYTLQHHSEEVTCLAVSHSDEFAFTGSQDATVVMWRIRTGKIHHTFTGHDAGIRDVYIRADDRYMACLTCEGGLYIWDLKQLKKVATCDPSADLGEVTCVALTCRHEILLGTSSGVVLVRQWSPDSGETMDLGSLTGQSSEVAGLALTCDGTLLASAYDVPYVIVWHLKSMEKLYQFKTGSVKCMCFTGDNQFLVTGASDRKLLLWSIADGTLATNLYTYSNLTAVRTVQSSLIVACTKIGQLMAFHIHLPGEAGQAQRDREMREKRRSLVSFTSNGSSIGSSSTSGALSTNKLSKFCSIL